MIPRWENFPDSMKNECTLKYYNLISSKRVSLITKRFFDVICSLIFLIILFPIIILSSILIKLESIDEPIFFKQKRITQYGKEFSIIKFRTMKSKSNIDSSITYDNDPRITKIGRVLRKFRIDEIPQLINVLIGQMSFVGTRPEVQEYVNFYDNEMRSTLILPAGITSIASIKFKDEEKLLRDSENIQKTYIENILPNKMVYNIEYIKQFNFLLDIKIMLLTFYKVFLR